MASRKEQKQLAREQRLKAEAEAAAARSRVKRLQLIGAASASVVAIAVAAGALSLSGRSDEKTAASRGAALTGNNLPGLQETVPPWPAEDTQLADRLDALKLPTTGDDPVHYHVMLTVYVDGKKTTVPSELGSQQGGSVGSPINTHEANGVIHVESPAQFPYALGDIFGVWGVLFNSRALGGYVASGSNKISVFVDGKPVSQTSTLPLKDQANIVVAYGSTSSIDKEPDTSALNP